MVTMTKAIAQAHNVVGKKVKILNFKGSARNLEISSMEHRIGQTGRIVRVSTSGTGGDSELGKFEVRFEDGATWWFLGDLLEIKGKGLLAKAAPKIEVGTRVKLVNLKKPSGGEFFKNNSNTVGNTGVVTGISSETTINISVKWDNGSNNTYCATNLEVITTPKKEEETFKVGDIVIGSSTRYTRTTDKAIMRVESIISPTKVRVKIVFNSEISCAGESFDVEVSVLKKLKKGVAFTPLVE